MVWGGCCLLVLTCSFCRTNQKVPLFSFFWAQFSIPEVASEKNLLSSWGRGSSSLHICFLCFSATEAASIHYFLKKSTWEIASLNFNHNHNLNSKLCLIFLLIISSVFFYRIIIKKKMPSLKAWLMLIFVNFRLAQILQLDYQNPVLFAGVNKIIKHVLIDSSQNYLIYYTDGTISIFSSSFQLVKTSTFP